MYNRTDHPIEYSALTRSITTRRDQLVRRKFNFIDYGFKSFFVPIGGDIQEAINRAEDVGGGIILLGAGTHSPSSNIALPVLTPIQIVGTNTTSTIIDFGSADRRFILAGSGIYTTGTVSITSGVTVTGVTTAWLSSGLVVGDQIFLDSRWYEIAAITGDTTIILSEGYGGSALSGATYRAGSIVKDVEFKELTIKNSTSTSGAVDADDIRNFILEDVNFVSNNKSAVITNFSEWNANRIVSASATGDGFTFTTGTFCTNSQFANVANGGHGCVLNGVKKGSFTSSSTTSNTNDGFNLTSCTSIHFVIGDMNSNGGQGIELVSGNSFISVVVCAIENNTSDGIKLTASSDDCRVVSSQLKSNGGYGINIAASTCDNNTVLGNFFVSNVTAASNDSGTGTLIRSNIGLADN